LARRKYLGRANEELDAMFAELESIDRSTKTGRRKHRALSNKIRRKREDRILSGIRGLFGSRKYPVPATASGAASTMGFPGVPESPIGIGTMAEAPPVPDIPIEEITVDAKRRRRSEPNIELAELPVTQSRAPSLRAQVPFGIYTGELAEQFGNETEPQKSMISKLGRNQLRSLERRKKRVAQYPDAYPPDYATPEGMFKYAEGKTIEGNRMIGEGGTLFDPTDPTDLALLGLGMAPIPGARIAAGAGKLRKLAKLKDFRKSNFIRDNQTRDIVHKLANLKSGMNPKNMKFDPVFTGADAPLTWAQLGARAKTKSGVTALQPTREALEEMAEKQLFEGVKKGGLGITALAGYMANSDTSKDEKEIKELTEEEMDKMERILSEIEKEKAFYGEDVDAWSPENMNSNYAGGGQLMGHAQQLANAGRGEDTMLMHVTPSEVQGIASLAPGMMTTNPQTGLPEAGIFKDILGFALPFLGTMVGIPPWLSGAVGAKLRGGDFKDMVLGAGTGALMGKLGGKLSEVPDIGAVNLANEAATTALSSPETFSQAMQGIGEEGFKNIAAKAAIDPNLLQTAVSGGADPLSYLSTVAKPAQISSFASGLSDVAQTNLPNTFGQNIKNIGAGLPAVTDALMSPEGMLTIAGTGLGATRDATRRWDQSILDREEQRKKEEEELYRMYPENIPYRGGGSLYKNRYINGNWS